MFKPQRLGTVTIPDAELTTDKKNCKKIGPCGVGEKAIYLNSFYFDRRYYIPISSIERIFKRIAMSKGGFTGKGAFGTLSYLVVVYENGKEKQCNFKHEEDVDRLLAYIEERFPQIPLHSIEAERKLEEKRKWLEEKQRERILPEEIKKRLTKLERAENYLKKQSDYYMDLSLSAKKKRTYDRSNPAYKWVALAVVILGIGLKYIMSPPLRTQQDLDALWKGLEAGEIQIVATDHCPFNYAKEKQDGKDDFRKCPNGAPGVEERMILLFSEGVMKNKISINKLVEVACTNPAKVYGMYPKKGIIEPGADGDLVIIDADAKQTLTHKMMHGAVDYTSYEGTDLHGKIDLVMQRGNIIAENNEFKGNRGDGKYLYRKPFLGDL